MKRKLWRKFNGKKYRLWVSTKNKASADVYVNSEKKKGYFVRRVIRSDGTIQLYKRKNPKR